MRGRCTGHASEMVRLWVTESKCCAAGLRMTTACQREGRTTLSSPCGKVCSLPLKKNWGSRSIVCIPAAGQPGLAAPRQCAACASSQSAQAVSPE